MPMLDLKRFRKAIVSYIMHSPFVKQMLNSWSVCYRIKPDDWIEMVEGSLQLVHYYSEIPHSEKRLRLLNNRVKVEVWKSPKSNLFEKETISQ